MTNSRESTSIIISMPPGKMLLVVISRSLCECHMKAKPASPLGELAIVPEGGVLPVAPQFWFVEPLAEAVYAVPGAHPVARVVASGPRYGLPPYQAPFVNRFGSGRVTGPLPATSPKGAACTGLLWSWHHS